ncbi:NADH-quinone oxidoreductase subunit NuoH [Actinocrinis sp.]|uniref:NADH-quinone oxidoreductase subunit NuoH n=1 Tax=Actinocrinis sp. TaxID=1920516 RepID=UPI002D38CA70|nr:NADH-quinone oxidoreductase subunit NuoH [Actinocrinis sp.]HZP53252.1 NADH-quinone oxidoreductase subunit NuoH [Actinocrinis sp.]
MPQFPDNATNWLLGSFDTHIPWWFILVVIKAIAAFAILVVLTLFNIWYERRIVSFMQMRIGPNRVGPQGLLQSLADGVKLALKEDIVPKNADKPVFWLAPLLSAIPAFLAIAVIPWGPKVSIFHHWTTLQLVDLPIGVLYILAISSIGIYGVVLAGWSSGSTYPLLGAMRSSAQMISYEVAMGLSFVGVFLYAGTMSTAGIVDAQQHGWYFYMLPLSAIIYIIAMVGETNRAPFDLPEAEGELVGGFHTEYSSLKFALFFLAEYINLVTVSALAVTMFFGGWRAPWPITAWWSGANGGWYPMIWFLVKLLIFVFVFIWLRGTLPRLRYDQFMAFGWKVLIPTSVIWLLVVATFRQLRNAGDLDRAHAIPIGIGIAALFLLLVALLEIRERNQIRRTPPPSVPAYEPLLGGFPVPPMPGQSVPPAPRRPQFARTAAEPAPALPGTTAEEASTR